MQHIIMLSARQYNNIISYTSNAKERTISIANLAVCQLAQSSQQQKASYESYHTAELICIIIHGLTDSGLGCYSKANDIQIIGYSRVYLMATAQIIKLHRPTFLLITNVTEIIIT